MLDTSEADQFAEIIVKMKNITEALIIDDVNNPGGNLLFMFGLLSMLSDNGLRPTMHRMLIDEADAAVNLIRDIREIKGEEDVKKTYPNGKISGFPVSLNFLTGWFEDSRGILRELSAGNRLTSERYLFGVASINPAAQVYTKPLIVLTNALSISCSDFFPAILQDNQRAKIFGVRTSGAGGSVKQRSFPNQFGISVLNATWTNSVRPNGQTLENLGVTPDYVYDFQEEDLKSNFSSYKRNLNDYVQKILVDIESNNKPWPKGPGCEAPLEGA